MKNLMTHKFIFGLLMAFVLALGVQSIADALTFGTTRRGDLATAGIDDDFTITFSVTLGSNTTRIYNVDGDLVSEGGARIDSSGYNVFEATNGREYRLSTAANALTSTFVGSRPSYSDQTPQATATSGTLYVSGGSATSEGSVVNSGGATVYIRSGAGTRDDPNTADNENDPFRYTAARAMPDAPQTNAARYHYNDEQVNIVPTGASIIKVGSTSITPVTSTNTLTLRETVANSTDARPNTDPGTRLTSSITLTLRANAAAVVGIAITDETPNNDRPGGEAPQQDFTVYVVSPQSDSGVVAGSTSFASGNDGIEFAYDGESRQINNYFVFAPEDNAPVHYSVEGSGRVYVRINDRRTNATNSLFTGSNAPVYLDTNRGTSKVTVWVSGTTPRSAIFIFQGASLNQFTNMEITHGDNQLGAPGGRLEDYLEVKVTDGNNSPVSGVAVQFSGNAADDSLIPFPGTSVYVDGNDALVGTLTDPVNADTFTATSSVPAPADPIFVQTDSSGLAKVYYQLSATAGNYRVTANLTGSPSTVSQVFRSTAVAGARKASLTIVSGDGQSAGKGEPLAEPLVVIARSTAGHRIAGVMIEFETTTGLLESGATSGQEVVVTTGSDGMASVTYNVGQVSGARSVTAEVTDEQDDAVDYDFVIERVEFKINGGGSTTTPTTPTTPTPPTTPTTPSGPDAIASVSGNNQSGPTGSALTNPLVVEVVDSDDAPLSNIRVTFEITSGSGTLTPQSARTGANGQASTQLTPTGSGSITVEATVDGVASAVTFTATASALISQLQLDSGNNQTGAINSALDEPLSVRVVDQDNNGVRGQLITFRTVEGSGRFSPSNGRRTTDTDGYASISFTPRSSGTIEVEASSGDLDPVTFTITTGDPPDAIVMVSGNNQSGRPGATLANPFVVEVVDENDDPVAGISVTFAVTAGGGSVSQASATTNNSGRAQTTLTLGDDPGDNTVAARVSGLTAVTFKATSGAEVLVNASQRAPMYWVSRAEGKLHRLVDAEIENLASNVTGVTSIAVDTANSLLYFAVQTGPNRGAIRRANLNGSNVRTLKTLTAVPNGIAVDSAGENVYWTNSRGRIQTMATEGSTQITNVVQNLSNPTAIAISNGNLYWAEPLGRISRVNLTGQQNVRNIATGLGDPLSIAIAKGKIYWIERAAGGGGSLNRANPDGANAQTLKTFASGVPTSIAVDSSDNKIYWTKGTGKIQRANLVGRFVKDIASGLMNPSGIALNVAALANTTGTQQANNQQTGNQQTTYSMYDVNRDGAINNSDTRAVASAIGQSGSAIANARTDVDGSGEVDVTDLILVLGNLDDDVAAPAIDIDVKALDIDFDRVQEQVEVLLASGDRSIAAQRALLYLQHLLASARPDETVLLANYPNPFNPETWIPYHLSESTDVRVNIYDAQGVLVACVAPRSSICRLLHEPESCGVLGWSERSR